MPYDIGFRAICCVDIQVEGLHDLAVLLEQVEGLHDLAVLQGCDVDGVVNTYAYTTCTP